MSRTLKITAVIVVLIICAGYAATIKKQKHSRKTAKTARTSAVAGNRGRAAAVDTRQSRGNPPFNRTDYRYPEQYRGMYLTVNSANKMDRLQQFVEKAKAADINTFVIDVQNGKSLKCNIPPENVQYCKDNGIHPVARVVMFPDGLKHYPIQASYLQERIGIAEDSCKNGFTEIQFDYIRFHDSPSTRHLTLKQKYAFIEKIITTARERIKKYNAVIAVDIFGRVPLNRNDVIGQNIESLDRVADMICPMAYPSHYTWSAKYQKDPYCAVHETSVQARNRAKNAVIVTYIQAFKMKLFDIPYEKYIISQLKAVRDAEIRGYILWNARQDYDIPLKIVKNFNASSPRARKPAAAPTMD